MENDKADEREKRDEQREKDFRLGLVNEAVSKMYLGTLQRSSTAVVKFFKGRQLLCSEAEMNELALLAIDKSLTGAP